jgi:DNA polymerase-3 subunit epsilon
MNFIALDVETAQGKRWSICQIGLVFVENSKIANTYSQLVQPPENEYFYRNTQIHGIKASDTRNAPFFPEIWKEIFPLISGKKLVAHNAAFDMDCLRKTLSFYNMEIPDL